MKTENLALALGLVAALAAGAAKAAFILTLDDLSTAGIDVSVTDNLAGDLVGMPGIITYSGSVGAFPVTVTTGISKPVISSPPGIGDLDLNSIVVRTAGGAGTLQITLTDTDYAGVASLLDINIGGTLAAPVGSTLTADGFLNGTDLLTLGPFGPGAYAGTTSTAINAVGPYSLGIMATLVFTGAGSASFDISLAAVPEPATLALFGLGLAGIGAARRRRTVS